MTILLAQQPGLSMAQIPPAAPDAGQTLRELQQPLPLTPGTQAPTLQAPAPRQADTPAGERVEVRAFVISGNAEIGSAELQAQISDLTGPDRSLADLRLAANRLSAFYRRRGYAVARAYLPQQDIVNGVVTINIIEGRVASHRIDNRSRLSDPRARAWFDDVREDSAIRTDAVDRSLLLLGDTPGVGSARATLQPGASVGTSDLLVELTPGPAVSGNVSMDNHGNRYTGEYRLSGAVNANSPLGIGDQLSLNALTSGNELRYGRVAYQLPIGSQGLRVGAAYFDARYKLGREFETLEAHGTARSTSLFTSYPLIRSQQANLYTVVSAEHKTLSDLVDTTTVRVDKRVNLISAGLVGNLRDGLNGGAVNNAELSLVQGRLAIDSPDALAIDNASARSNGDYTRMSWRLGRQQRIADRDVAILALAGQQASKNLDSSEKFALGGINGVRAYPQGEGIGDEGYLVTLEWRHRFGDAVQGSLFYDAGEVIINREPFDGAADNKRRLAGAGVGLDASVAGFQASAALAWRTDGGTPNSIPISAAGKPTFWVQLGRAF